MHGQLTARASFVAGAAIVVTMIATAPAAAQSEKLIGVGIGVSTNRLASDSKTHASVDWIIFRIPRPERLGIAWDIGSTSTDMAPGVTPSSPAGELRLRHFLFGPGYTIRQGRSELTLSALAGPSFNRFKPADDAAASTDVSAGDSLSYMGGVTWYIDLGPRWGVKLSTAYLIARPDLVTRSAGGEQRSRWKGDRFTTQLGLVFGIY